MRERNCLSVWFPKLVGAGLPVPRTEIVKTDCDLIGVLDGKTPDGYDAFIATLRNACDTISRTGPWFLRTGQGSGKHNWDFTCNLTSLERLSEHIAALVEWSHIVDFFGLTHDVWVVRERLPVEPIIDLPGYSGMPLVPEIRAFVKDGKITCRHEYWPLGSIDDGLKVYGAKKLEKPSESPAERAIRAQELFSRMIGPAEYEETRELTMRVAEAFDADGAWSVDLLKTTKGWYVTDMADADMSFHLPGCPNAKTQAEFA
jgi:hypothetical protein